jgi:peptidoglycan/xylan/chitin deacetylase (PgdA/CDA1 family)
VEDVDEPKHGLGLHLGVSRFRAQMEWLAANYTVVSLRELDMRLRTGKTLRSIAVLTFDDAYRGIFDVALPILRELQLPSSVFVVSQAAQSGTAFWWDHPVAAGRTESRREHWLTALRGDAASILRELGDPQPASLPSTCYPADWATLRAASGEGLELGVHSATHRTLTELDGSELLAELNASREALLRLGGVAAQAFAYPYGIWNARVRDATRDAGYTMALSLDRRLVTRPVDQWALPRINIPSGISQSAFESWLGGWSA